MSIGKASSKNPAKKTSSRVKEAGSAKPTVERQNVKPLQGFEERATTLRIYVKEKELLKEVKRAAFEEEISLSQLWEEWAQEWLRRR